MLPTKDGLIQKVVPDKNETKLEQARKAFPLAVEEMRKASNKLLADLRSQQYDTSIYFQNRPNTNPLTKDKSQYEDEEVEEANAENTDKDKAKDKATAASE